MGNLIQNTFSVGAIGEKVGQRVINAVDALREQHRKEKAMSRVALRSYWNRLKDNKYSNGFVIGAVESYKNDGDIGNALKAGAKRYVHTKSWDLKDLVTVVAPPGANLANHISIFFKELTK